MDISNTIQLMSDECFKRIASRNRYSNKTFQHM